MIASFQPASPQPTVSRLEAYLQNLQRFGIRPGLERIRALLKATGEPQKQYPIVLVGGTNGKGSTCEFLARMLAGEEKKVGLYTSPHLYRWNERIRILPASGEALFPGAITDAELDALFAEALPHIEAVARDENLGQPTEFEVLTFLGLWHFARQKVDVAVVEVGLGGKWDATNATEPTVSVITHVALDHCDRLGSTLEAIARDKVEIARPGRVLVTGETKPAVLRVLEEHCQKANVQLEKVEFKNASQQNPDFQTINLATARAAHRVLGQTLDWPINRQSSIVNRQSVVPGRFEIIREKPLVILDGANNPDGASTLARRLRATLDEKNQSNQTAARLILVLGILADKDWLEMTRVLALPAAVVIATQSQSPRAADPTLIAAEAQKYVSCVETSTPVGAAFSRALALARENDVICVTGSFYTIAEIERERNF